MCVCGERGECALANCCETSMAPDEETETDADDAGSGSGEWKAVRPSCRVSVLRSIAIGRVQQDDICKYRKKLKTTEPRNRRT